MTSSRICCIALTLMACMDFRLCLEFVERQTEYGRIMGIVKEVIPGKSIEMFLGVPYAKPPIGDLRFEYTKKPESWTGLLNTTRLPPACPQHFDDMDYLQIHSPLFNRTSEDCLYVNIYVPKTDHVKYEDRLSTFLWIHGGSNEFGMGAMLTGEVLAAYGGVIVVNFNFRLGHLGFLQLDSKLFPGNFGLVDQTEAIHWVHRNIHFFGGEASKMTLAGHSAGATDVGIHLLNPNLKGLFRHAIMMSGSPLSYWAIMNDQVKPVYQRKVQIYLKSVGCVFGDITNVKRCLKSKHVSDLTRYLRVTVPRMLVHPMSVDNKTLFDTPVDLLLQGKFAAIPVMLGFTRDEGAMITEANPNSPWMLFDYTRLKEAIIDYRNVIKFSSRFEEIVAHEYINYTMQEEYQACVQAYVQIESDISIKVPTLHFATWMLYHIKKQENPSKVFLYSYEYENEETFQSVFFKILGKPAVSHGQDLFYVFGIPLIGHAKHNFTSTDVSLSKHLMTLWSKFVKTGNLSEGDAMDGETFPSFDSKRKHYIRISNNKTDYDIQSARPYNMRAYNFWTRVEFLFWDWIDVSCNSSGFNTLDLILCFFIFLFLRPIYM